MAELRASEMLFGRSDDPAGYLDTTAAPVVTRYANHGPAAPSPYGGPPLPPYEPISAYPPGPTHFLPPYDYVPDPAASIPQTGGRREIPPNDLAGNATEPPPRQRELLPPHDPPADMVIPGVQHPDGRFEPHPYFARRSPALGPPVEPEPGPEPPAQPSKKTVEVAVPVCCEECKERITNYVGQTPGVDAVECDVYDQRVKVTGDLSPGAVLQRCQKCFRKSTLV